MNKPSESVTELFGSNVFNDIVMRSRLPKNVYNSMKKTIEGNEPLDLASANVIANAMKDWAVEKGAAHFCHWFQPMTGSTAEKHDSFISPTPQGNTIMEFSGKEFKLGVSTLPPLPKDCTDRNRTSPLAFTGNKFEFRMVGSTQSTSGPMFVLNTIVADVLREIADELHKARNVKTAAQKILQNIATKHRKIIYNGDNYTNDWGEDAEKRGLPNIRSTVASLETIMDKENVAVFKKHGVLTEAELHARTEILLEAYSMSINIEAKTMLDIAWRQILPACIKYSSLLGESVCSVSKTGVDAGPQKELLKEACDLIATMKKDISRLEKTATKAGKVADATNQARLYRDEVIPAMQALREAADKLETIVDANLWPIPTYAEMLFLK